MEEVKDTVNKMREELDLDEKEYDPEIYRAIRKKIEAMEELGSEEGEGYQAIAENTAVAAEYREKLEELDLYFTETDGELTEDNVRYYRSLTEQYRNSIDGFDLSTGTGTGSGATEEESVNTDFIVKVNNRYQTDFWTLAEDISESN